MRLARAAGWSWSDLLWERLMEKALLHWERGAGNMALWWFWLAFGIARFGFAGDDLRLASCHANFAIICFARGRETRARAHQARALAIWRGAGEQIARMEIRPRARSSLFHLRMEARHREVFMDNMRVRIGRFAEETEETLGSLAAPKSAGHRHFSRWRGERPGIYDDMRKLLSACLLIIDRP